MQVITCAGVNQNTWLAIGLRAMDGGKAAGEAMKRRLAEADRRVRYRPSKRGQGGWVRDSHSVHTHTMSQSIHVSKGAGTQARLVKARDSVGSLARRNTAHAHTACLRGAPGSLGQARRAQLVSQLCERGATVCATPHNTACKPVHGAGARVRQAASSYMSCQIVPGDLEEAKGPTLVWIRTHMPCAGSRQAPLMTPPIKEAPHLPPVRQSTEMQTSPYFS